MNSFKYPKSTLRLFWEVIQPFALAALLLGGFALLLFCTGCEFLPLVSSPFSLADAASAVNESTGQLVLGLAAIFGLLAVVLAIASYFATRREVDELKTRVTSLEDNLDEKTGKIHNRINRLLAGQYMMAGQLGVILDDAGIASKMRQLETEEEL